MKKLVAVILCAMLTLTAFGALAQESIVWAGWSGEEEACKDIFGRMMTAYETQTGNDVNWIGWTWADTTQQLLIRLQGGEQLDVARVDIGIFNTLAQAGVLADMNEIVGKEYLAENFEEAALAVSQVNGEQLAMPWSMASITMVYNPELLAKAGWTEVPKTVEEFEKCLADVKALDPSIVPYAVSTKDAMRGRLHAVAVDVRRRDLRGGRQREHQLRGRRRLHAVVQEPA